MLLTPSVKNYDWGRRGNSSLVAQLAPKNVQVEAEKPYSELWMGAHPSGPSTLPVHNDLPLEEYIAANPEVLGSSVLSTFGPKLPFLFKVLSVNQALSIQAHPDKESAGILHKGDPKNYPDDNHKPELAIALTPFEVLCGFRPMAQVHKFMEDIPELRELLIRDSLNPDAPLPPVQEVALEQAFRNLMTSDRTKVAVKVNELLERGAGNVPEFELVSRLNQQFPGDIGIFCVYLFNHFTLAPGEAVFIPANEPHAYLSGDCMECMANSDNVVRAGLTPKYIDIPTITKILTFAHGKDWIFRGKENGDGRVLYKPPVKEFAVESIEAVRDFNLHSKDSCSIVLLLEGECQLNEHELSKGSVVFVPAGTSCDFRIKTKSKLFRAFCP